MKLGALNLLRTLQPVINHQLRSTFSDLSADFMQDKLRETRSRSRAMSKLNPRNFEIDSKLTEVMSERNVITERVKRGLSGHADNLADAMSLPDNHINVNTDRETVVNNHELGKSQSVPKLGLKNSLVTKTHDNGSLRLLDLLRKTHFSTAEKEKKKWNRMKRMKATLLATSCPLD